MKPLETQPGLLRTRCLRFLTIVFAVAAGLYLGKGFYHLAFDPNPAIPTDFKLRWQEQQYVLKGINPYAVKALWNEELPEKQRTRIGPLHEIDPQIGMPTPGYPPWAYFTGLLFAYPSDWTAARWCFAILQVVLLAALITVIYRLSKPHGSATAAFLCTATLAFGSICTTLGNGQYGIAVIALLMLALHCHASPLLIGLLFGLAMIKPTLSLPFVVILLLKRQWTALAGLAVYLIAASCFTWRLTGIDPVSMTSQMMWSASWWGIEKGADLISLLHTAGWDKKSSSPVITAVIVAGTTLLLLAYRRSSLLTLFAICSLAARLWTYHRAYDNLILVFLFVALGIQCAEKRHPLVYAAFAFLGLTLWLPMSIIDNAVGHALMILIWVFGLTVLLMHADHERAAVPNQRQWAA